MSKIWNYADVQHIKTPYEYLFEYANQLKEDTNGLIEGQVTEIPPSDGDEEVTYTAVFGCANAQ